MTPKMALYTKLRDTRKKIRDAASAASEAAEEQRSVEERARRMAEDSLSSLFDGAASRFQEASSVSVLLRFHEERRVAEMHLREMRDREMAASAEAEKRRSVLKVHARELKIAERAVERLNEAQKTQDRRGEQRAQDDLQGRRS